MTRDPEKLRLKYRRRDASRRKRVIEGYGGKCACCGEANLKFLTLDHKNADGKKDRGSKNANNKPAYKRALRENFPDDLQVLCWNCNTGRHNNGGVCPHLTPTP